MPFRRDLPENFWVPHPCGRHEAESGLGLAEAPGCIACLLDGRDAERSAWAAERAALREELAGLYDEVRRLNVGRGNRETEPRQGRVYFIRRHTDGAIKIGTSVHTKRRLADLRVGAGPLTLLGTIPGGRDREWQVQRRFNHLRKRSGEWFRPGPDLLEFIATEAT